jgi:trehalose 6-phosphate synthase/phosphatase
MSRLLIISNRLPVSIARSEGELVISPSVGGLATGLASFYRTRECLWIGWPGLSAEDCSLDEQANIRKRLGELQCAPVFLSRKDFTEYYNGFCNQTIWPLFHYFPQYARYRDRDWEAYCRVNRAFADAVLDLARADDVIWVHDYQLMLLPGMLRNELPGAEIGFFLHIPFPSSEILRLLPWREELLRELLGADLIGFHTYDYTRHFLTSVRRVLGISSIAVGRSVLPVGRRVVHADAFPMGIEYERFAGGAGGEDSREEIAKIREAIGERKVILSIDRLDYSKGMLQRLDAFEHLLETHPEYHGKVTLVMKAIESRPGIEQYDELKRRLDEGVGKVNGRFGTLDWVPVLYLFRYIPEETLIALYRLSDVALLTPLRDGMNLIAKEYLAAKTDGDGVLILSEMAGAEQELREALIVNPNDRRQIVESLVRALEMPTDERRKRNLPMQNRMRRSNVIRWAEEFTGALSRIKKLQRQLETKRIAQSVRRQLIADYRAAAHRLLLLDCDGTLVPIVDDPEAAQPTVGVVDHLRVLSTDAKTSVAILSGRPRETLEAWFGDLDVRLVAEHGIWLREVAAGWRMIQPATAEWKDDVRPLLEWYVDRTPGSRLEEKEFSLFWDYRGAEELYAQVRSGELKEDLGPLMQSHSLRVLEGIRFLEVQSAGITEGAAALLLLAERDWDFVLAAGDDVSDEETFQVLPDHGYALRIGQIPSRARYSVDSPEEFCRLLADLAAASG